MPPSKDPTKQTVSPSMLEYGVYPPEAYDFVQQGLSFTVEQIHGKKSKPRADRHVSGQELCEGIREYALSQWGCWARAVLRQWNVTGTIDFGRIVFALIEAGQMQRTDNDCVDDFQNVYDFKSAFETEYRIPVTA